MEDLKKLEIKCWKETAKDRRTGESWLREGKQETAKGRRTGESWLREGKPTKGCSAKW